MFWHCSCLVISFPEPASTSGQQLKQPRRFIHGQHQQGHCKALCPKLLQGAISPENLNQLKGVRKADLPNEVLHGRGGFRYLAVQMSTNRTTASLKADSQLSKVVVSLNAGMVKQNTKQGSAKQENFYEGKKLPRRQTDYVVCPPGLFENSGSRVAAANCQSAVQEYDTRQGHVIKATANTT